MFCPGVPHQPVLAVIAEVLQLTVPRALLDQIAPRVIAEILAADQRADIATAQLAVGFLFLLDLATQLVESTRIQLNHKNNPRNDFYYLHLKLGQSHYSASP